MRTLILFLHADPSVRPLYTKALEGIEHDIAFVNAGAFSAPYQALGRSLRDGGGRVLPRLLARALSPTLAARTYDSIVIVTFSAGYALARELFVHAADRDAIDAYVGIDTLHAGFDPDGTASDAQLWGFVKFALEAKLGGRTFYLGHSDVPTKGYASTTQAAQELVRLVGGTGGRFLVRAYNVRPDAHHEHIAALNEWGPGFVREALDAAQAPGDVAPEEELPDLGLAVLRAAERDMNLCPKEETKNAGPWIAKALGALGLEAPNNYCASAVTVWIREGAAELGVRAPVIGSAGAQALMAQFKSAGRWLSAEDARSRVARGEEGAPPGSIPVWDRATKPGGWEGHTGVTHTPQGPTFFAIEANGTGPRHEPDAAIAMHERRYDDPKLFGFGLPS